MRGRLRTLEDLDVRGKRVLVRADLNVPLVDGDVGDDTRIVESLATVRALLERGASVILCSHLGRPKGVDPALSLAPVAKALERALGVPVPLAGDCIGSEAERAAAGIAPGSVLLLENLRFHKEEEANDAQFAASLARLADVYVNDAFGAAHRAHASTAGVARLLPSAAGLLMEKEVRYLGELVANPPHPFAAVTGGAKVSSKVPAIEHLLPLIDILLVGGGMANTFLKATGINVQASLVEDDLLDDARRILERASERGLSVHLPTDCIAAGRFAADADVQHVPVDSVPPGYMILDIGPETASAFEEALEHAKAVVWNGPMGVFEMEPFARGSLAVAHAIAALDAVTVAGGGETAAVVALAGVKDKFTHVSTGGGASLEMLEGRELPGVAALMES
jgi:phosphoglycerate kinase